MVVYHRLPKVVYVLIELRALMKVASYRDLVAWQRGMALAKMIYVASAQFPREETFGLKSQMRTCAVSVPSNIAEGQGRTTRGEFHQFLGQARGSLYELETQTLLASELGYLSNEQRETLIRESRDVGRILNGLMSSIRPVAPR
jgi:four helix bundle protein